ncbi:MAG: VWA domain-containing protein [Candidatus Tectimicrobiota bacterium]
MKSYRYTHWDGTQDVSAVDADDLMDAMSDDLMSHGDLGQALRNLMRRGMQGNMGSGFEGIRELMERLRQQSRERLERYNLASMIDELKKRLDDIVQQERSALAPGQAPAPPAGDPDGAAEPSSAGPENPAPGAQRQAAQAGQRGEPGASGATASQRQAGQTGQSGQQGQAGQPGQPGAGDPQQRMQFLDALPPDFAGQVKALNNYDFVDSEAQRAFDELMQMLQQQAMGNMFREMAQRMADMTPEDLQRLKDMLADLNQMMDQQVWGEQPDFQNFMQKYGDMFGQNPPQSLDQLVQQLASQMSQMQSLFNSLPEDVRQELQDMLSAAFNDEALAAELAELQANLNFLSSDEPRGYEFSGAQGVPLEQAMRLMDELQKVDQLQEQLANIGRQGSLQDVDAETLEQILGPEGRRELDKLRELEQRLEAAGYLKRKGDRLELTAKGVRKIGQKALNDIFSRLKMSRPGGHRTDRHGVGIEATHDTKPYEYGDPFNLDLQHSVMNAVVRNGSGTPVRMQPEDFEVFKAENLNQCSTVLMLDQSRSMGLNGCFEAAKKVSLALHSLIKMQYPRDRLYIIGFSEYAHELDYEDIPAASWGSYYPGTNMHHALMIARRLLSKQRYGTRQVLMITDGEPTAHLEQGVAYFNYPPSWRTIEQTLMEVKRCTKDGIIINTFMMEQDPYLMRFVQEITRINRGRAFFSSPGHLGEYIVTDYINNKRRKRIA